MTSDCAHIAVRREIDSLNERLTGDGQAIEGGDPTKGALKTKGNVFPSQRVACVNIVNGGSCACRLKWQKMLKLFACEMLFQGGSSGH